MVTVPGVVYLINGLALFTLGLAALLESRRKSGMLLARQLPWLAAFGLSHSVVEWGELVTMTMPGTATAEAVVTVHIILLPLSALFLIRFGVGLISESGPLPRWLLLSPLVFLIPVGLLVTYAIVVALTEPNVVTASDIWSRYLLYIPGATLAAAGYLRQARELHAISPRVRSMMLAAGGAFLAYAFFAGLVVPRAAFGLAPWLNYDLILQLTGLPVQVWRTLAAFAVTLFVVRALDVFEVERKQQIRALSDLRRQAEATLKESELRFRNVFEFAPIGMDIVSVDGRPLKANRALQEMLGYSEQELREMTFPDYTHPDDCAESAQQAEEVRQGRLNSFQMEKRYIHKDGHLVQARATVAGVRDAAGRLSHFIAMVEDVTEQKQHEAALRHERERAQEERAKAQEARVRAQTEARLVAEMWVNTLVEISQRIVQMESADSVLTHIVGQGQRLLQADSVSLGLFDDTGQILEMKFQAAGAKTSAFHTRYRVDNDDLVRMLRSARSYCFPDEQGLSNITWYCPTVAREIKTAAVVPLQFDGQVVGGIWAARYSAVEFTPAQLFGLENLADQAVIALQHASMAAQLQSIATLEERSRIAREMHDGLAQILGYLGLQMQTLEAYVKAGKQEELLGEIRKTRENIKLAQADVRENILSLRTTLAGEAGLIPALQEYVAEFGVQTAAETTFCSDLKSAPNLSPLAEVQLVRIVQEALTNVRKHAHASRVEVTLSTQDGGLAITVSDDGCGIGADKMAGNGAAGNGALRGHSFGLQTMGERAESIGGKLTIDSKPEQGTAIRLWLPTLNDAA